MKSTYMFRDQVNIVTNWFQSWNECEQTVALYSLLRKITPTQAKFLIQVLEQGLQDCTEVQLTENQANSPAYISSLCNESKEHAVSMLLACLPLLRPGSTDAKAEYLKIIPKILSHSIDNGCHIEESRQLLSYSLIHPAISPAERAQFTSWLGHLEERFAASQTNNGICPQTPGHPDIYGQYTNPGGKNAITNVGGFTQNLMQGMTAQNSGWMDKRDSGIIGDSLPAAEQRGSPSSSMLGSAPPSGPRAITSSAACPLNPLADYAQNANHGHLPLHATLSGPPAFHSVPSQGSHGQVSNGHRRLTRSSSVTPPMTAPGSNVPEWLNRHHEEMARSSRSHSSTNSEPHAPLSPQSSITSSGSGSDPHHEDQHNQRNSFLEEGTGMRDVPIWLKSLRLHKYAYLFQMMEYEEMMTLSEDWLESQNVTKGARNKIILSIKKLKERPNMLRSMEKEIMETGNMKQALSEVKGMLNTPIKCSGPQPGSEATAEEENKENAGAEPQEIEIPEGDIPGQVTRVLGKVCTQLLVSSRPEDEAFSMYLQLMDKCLMHEAFSIEQKKKLSSWKQQVQKIWHPPPQKYNLDRQRKSFGGSNTFPLNNLLRGGIGPSRALRGQQPPAKWAFTANRQTMPLGGPAVPGAGMPLYRNNSFNTAYNARPAMMEVGRPLMKQPVTRTHSAPIRSSHFGLGLSQKPTDLYLPLSVADMNATEPEINARLDSLCLSMTEHALGSLGESL